MNCEKTFIMHSAQFHLDHWLSSTTKDELYRHWTPVLIVKF